MSEEARSSLGLLVDDAFDGSPVVLLLGEFPAGKVFAIEGRAEDEDKRELKFTEGEQLVASQGH